MGKPFDEYVSVVRNSKVAVRGICLNWAGTHAPKSTVGDLNRMIGEIESAIDAACVTVFQLGDKATPSARDTEPT